MKSKATDSYLVALPGYATALETDPSPMGDLNLLYAAAKVFDPGSVVRESEQASIQNAQPIVESLAAQFGKQVLEGGSFSEKARENLRRELTKRMKNMKRMFMRRRAKLATG